MLRGKDEFFWKNGSFLRQARVARLLTNGAREEPSARCALIEKPVLPWTAFHQISLGGNKA